MKNMKAISALGAWNCRTLMKSLFAVLALMVASSAPLMAGDLEPGRYAIESAAHAKKFLRGLPEQGNKVVTAENPMATVLLVKAEDGDAYSLQSHAFFISVEGAHDVVMHKANGARERFKITKNPDGTFSLKAVWCGKYITVDKDGNVDSSKEPGDNAKFKLHKK